MQTTASSTANQPTTSEIESQRTRCEVWTRVMGYHRPVANFNVGKKSEHYSRLHFSESKSANSEFIKKFS
ncbi:MAG: anaerobic ribonucleoside-triphosphate reductase [Patescibacteria group bacterium]